MSCSYIWEINFLWVAPFANIFSHSEDCLFVLFIVSFAVQKHLSLIRCQWFILGFIEIKFCTIKFVNFKSVYDWRVLINAWNHVIIIKLQIQNFLSPPQVPPNPCSVCPLPSLGPWEQLICILLLHFAFSWV